MLMKVQSSNTFRVNKGVLIINALFCGLVGGAYGVSIGSPLGAFLSGAAIGVLVGVGYEWLAGKWRGHNRLYRHRMWWLILFEIVMTFYVVLPLAATYSFLHPMRLPVTLPPSQISASIEDVSFTTSDGIALKGWYTPSHNGAAIIAVHGYNGNRSHVAYHAKALADHGYGVLMFDMRAHGESGGDQFAMWSTGRDVQAAADYLKTRSDVQPDRIGAIGLSAGAHAILYGAAASLDVKALILDGTGSSTCDDFLNPFIPDVQGLWFMTPAVWMDDRALELFTGQVAPPPFKELVKHIAPRPMLFISAGQAEYETSLAQRYTLSAGPSAEAWDLPDVGHVAGIIVRPAEYTQKMLNFFDRTLRGQ
jgi:pimeloyl-ACP methyl ester carboxylesterase